MNSRVLFIVSIVNLVYYVNNIAGLNQYQEWLNQQKKIFLYSSTGLLSGYGTIKYLSFIAFIRDFSFLETQKGGYIQTLFKTLAQKVLHKHPGTQSIIKSITHFFSLGLRRPSLSAIARIYFGKKIFLGTTGLFLSIQELQKLKKHGND